MVGCVGMLLVVGVEGGLAIHVVCCAESQITGSPPLVSDLDILCEMEHEGLTFSKLHWGTSSLIPGSPVSETDFGKDVSLDYFYLQPHPDQLGNAWQR